MISSMIPYSLACCAFIMKSRSTSFSTLSNFCPLCLASNWFVFSRIRRISRAWISISVAWPQQPRVNVVGPLSPGGLLDDHGHQHHFWIVHVHPTLLPRMSVSFSREDSKASASCGLMVQKIEGLLVADSISDSIQRSITCQTRADRFRRLF